MDDSQPRHSLTRHEHSAATLGSVPLQSLTSRREYDKTTVAKKSESHLLTPPAAVAFQTMTTAPSPPMTAPPATSSSSMLSTLKTHLVAPAHDGPRHSPNSLGAGLHLKTDTPWYNIMSNADSTISPARSFTDLDERPSSLMNAPSRSPSFKKALANSASTNPSAPNSAFSSPMLNSMPDMTPLPSPLLSGDSPGPWRKLVSRPNSREYLLPGMADSALVTKGGEPLSSAIVSASKRRAYHGLAGSAGDVHNPNEAMITRERNVDGHARNRSISEYVPENMQVPKARHQTVSGSHAGLADSNALSTSPTESSMRRERNMAVERGLAPAHRVQSILPTPPASRTGAESSDSDSSVSNATSSLPRVKKSRYEYFDAHTRNDEKRRRWRALKVLGTGTFSRVVLATSQAPEEQDSIDEDDIFGRRMEGITITTEPKIDPKKVVAIKVCEHGPKGGASEERVEMSVKRELEIMQSIHHPSLVHLRAWNIEQTRAILVLSYCPGGDLFEVASEHAALLVPSLLRRMFAELVGAVQYLHERHIVHRDIKLENVLVNLPQNELAKPIDWVTYPYSVVTLTDLGLARRVADDEKLTTRCGSDDYAAPEVIMGQPYDGRAVDAWSLGALLYALLESRLPFDPTPGMSEGHKQRSKTSHRIARVEWRWVKYAGDDGDHEGDAAKFERAGLLGPMNVTEGLLKRARSRWPLAKVAEQGWVQEAILIEGGIKFREEDNPEEVDTPS